MSDLASREKILQIVRQEEPELIVSLILNMQAHIKSQSEQIQKIEAERALKKQHSFALEEQVKCRSSTWPAFSTFENLLDWSA